MKRYLFCLTTMFALGWNVSIQAAVTGQWDFNQSNLVATVGTDMTYFDTSTEGVTTFTTMMINGTNAVVMGFPAATSAQGYVMTHNVPSNGGGAYVNIFTLIMDVMFPASSDAKWRALFQTNTGNSNDGDLFVNPGNGIGIGGSYSGTIQANTWHRVAFVVDLTAAGAQQLKKFIDGVQVGSQSLGSLDGTYSLDPTALLFTDNDGETAPGYVNSIQIHDVALSSGDIAALGKASAAGIPTEIPVFDQVTVSAMPTAANITAGLGAAPLSAAAAGTGTITFQWYKGTTALSGQTNANLTFTPAKPSDAGSYTVVASNGIRSGTSTPPAVVTVSLPGPATVTGQWDFNGNLNATLGQPMQFFDAQVQSDTTFGTTTSFGISDINGQPATVAFINPAAAIGIGAYGGLVVPHGMAPNGGGNKVNQYTIIMDVLYPNISSGFYRALLQTDVANTNDADAFFNGNNGLGISSTYQGELGLDAWHRVVLAFDLTKREFGKYIDGTNVLTGPVGSAPMGPHLAQYLSTSTDPAGGGGVDMRWALGPTVLLFADGDDGEVQPVYVSSVQVRNGRMTDSDIALLGAPTVNKVPGVIKATRAASQIQIDWTGNVLESATSLAGPWSPVNGAAHPHTVTPSGTQFFRVVK